MTIVKNDRCPTTADKPLQDGLATCLKHYFKKTCKIARLERNISEYGSSFAIEDLKVYLENGEILNLIFKNLSRESLLEEARLTRPAFLLNPRREIAVYQSVLSQCAIGTATCYGSIIDESSETFWLFLEKVPATELYQVGEFETWLKVAQWLAELHKRFSEEVASLASEVPLLSFDNEYYARWPSRAREFLRHEPMANRAAFDRLTNNYDKVLEHLRSLPVTLIHGDFYASNILVQKEAERIRICPVDWEMTAAGPGLIDLAALVSGSWSADQQEALLSAYLHGWSPGQTPPRGQKQTLEDLAYCQLHVAVQWLGWSAAWSPPQEHQQDWLGQALRLSDMLDL